MRGNVAEDYIHTAKIFLLKKLNIWYFPWILGARLAFIRNCIRNLV